MTLAPSDLELLRRTSIRGRAALALTCIERALARFGERDQRILELVEVLWGYVEQKNLSAVDQAWRETRAADDLLEAVDKGLPLPESYRGLPQFLAKALDDAVWIGLSQMYGAVEGYGEESLDLTVGVVDSCARNGVAIPALTPFARHAFVEGDGWGPPVNRTFFTGDSAAGLAPGHS